MMLWIAGVAGVLVIAAAVHRPALFLLGWRYMRSNPRQAAVAVAGLMVGMAVLVGTGITTDSAAQELEAHLAEQRGVSDLLVRFEATPTEEAESWFASEDIEALGLAYRARNVAIDPIDGVGVSEVPVVGVDRDRYRRAVAWHELATVPDPDGVVLTRTLASLLGATAGDQVRLYLPPAVVDLPRYEPRLDSDTFDGVWVATARGPDGPVHSDDDVHRFSLDVPPYTEEIHLDLGSAEPAPAGNWSLVATDPDGEQHLAWGNTRSRLIIGAEPFAYVPEGEWTLEAHADGAVNQEFTVRYDVFFVELRPDGPVGPPVQEAVAWHTERGRFVGNLAAAAQGPDGPVHADADRYMFTLQVPDEAARVELTLEPVNEASGWTLVVTTPRGDVHMAGHDNAPLDVTRPVVRVEQEEGAWLEPGPWSVEVHADAAVDEDFQIRHAVVHRVHNPEPVQTVARPTPVVRSVAAVVDDSADPGGAGAAVFAPMELAQAIDGTDGVVDEAVLRLDEDADVPAVLARLQDQAATSLIGQDLRSGPQQEADRLRRQMGEIWTFMGGFTIASSLLLVFVLMALLVDERRPLLGTMRAVGAQRSDLTRMQTFEALGYGLGAALVGVLAGLGLSWVLRRQTQALWASGDVVVDPWGLLASVLIGLMLLLGFAALAAYRSAGLDIAAALRGEDTTRAGRPWGRLIGGVVLSVAAGLALLRMAAGDPVMVSLGPSLAIIAIGLFMSLRMSRHVVFPAVGGALLAWMVITYGVLADIGSAAEALLLPARALTFCTAAALLLIYSRPIHAGLSWLMGRLPGGFGFEAAMRQIRGRPGRATLTVLMLSMVILSVSFMQAVVGAESRQRWHDLGDYDVVATTDAPLGDVQAWLAENPPANQADPFVNVASWAHTTWSTYMPEMALSGGGTVSLRHGYGVSDGLADTIAVPVLAGPDAPEAMRQVLQDPGKVVVTADVLGLGHQPLRVGDTLRHDPPEGRIEVTVVAILDARWQNSVFMHPETLAALVNGIDDPRLVPGTAIFAIAEPGVEPEQVGREIAAGFREVGMTWLATGSDSAQEDAAALGGVLTVFVMLALAVGAVSLGLISARNVISRRREIGMVRSVGAQRGVVVGMVLAETLYLVAIAVAIGFVGTVMTLAGIGEDALRFDVVAAAGLAGYALLLGAVAAALPAWGAARMDPAEAVRYVE